MPSWIGVGHGSRRLRRMRLPACEEPLPVPHRLAIAYLALPLAVWLIGYFHWWFSVPLVSLLIASLWKCMAGSCRFRLPTAFFPILAISVLYVSLTPASNLVLPSGGDWYKHRRLLTDLVQSDWPAQTQVRGAEDDGKVANLRYYLGYYLVPAVLAKPFGLSALNWTVPLWTFLGWFIGTLVFVHGRSLAVAVVLGIGLGTFTLLGIVDSTWVLSSVLSWLGVTMSDLSLGTVTSPNHRSFTPGNDLQFFFRLVPQHSLPALIGTSLILQLKDVRHFHAVMAVITVLVAWWSPYNAVGVMALGLGVAAHGGLRSFISWQNLIAAPALLIPVTLFLLSNGPVSAQTRWVWELAQPNTLLWLLPFFYATTILPWCIPLIIYSEGRGHLVLVGSVVVLFIFLPIYQIESHYLHGNELLRNGMIPGVVAVWFWVGSLTCRILPCAVESLSPKHIVFASVIVLMLFPGISDRAWADVWSIGSMGLYRYEANPTSVGDYGHRDMYIVDDWHPALEAVLRD